MFCQKCGTENLEEAKFCKECGYILKEEKQTVVCPFCKAVNDKETVFCKRCGKQILTDDDKDIANEKENVFIERENKSVIIFFIIFSLFFSILMFATEEEFFIVVAIFFAIGFFGYSTWLISLLFLHKIKIDLKTGETILMKKEVSWSMIFLTNKRFICQGQRNLIWSINIKSNDADIKLWTNMWGKKKGIIISRKYEEDIKIELENSQRWLDKIAELRNSR